MIAQGEPEWTGRVVGAGTPDREKVCKGPEAGGNGACLREAGGARPLHVAGGAGTLSSWATLEQSKMQLLTNFYWQLGTSWREANRIMYND